MSKAAKSKRAGSSAKAARKRVSTPRKATGARKGAAKKPLPRQAGYPPYLLVFKGQDEEVQVEGPHTEFLSIGTPELGVKLEVSHNLTSTGPNLTIKISRS